MRFLGMSKNLVVTRADENIRSFTDITHPIIRRYAKFCEADFMPLDSWSPSMVGDGKYHYRIMKCKELLNDYDRILNLDSDILISSRCPDLFKLVPDDCIGTIFEDKGSRERERKHWLSQGQKKFGDIGWKDKYINDGVFLISKIHSSLFESINGEYWEDIGYDDVHIGYLIHKYNFKVHELPFQFNHMSMFSEPWNGSPSRFDSYIIHYAGGGRFPGVVGKKLPQLILEDSKIFNTF
jgi:lipopolysaccharide biosynthesis glycosyltransferase